jgi:hypothetical protein
MARDRLRLAGDDEPAGDTVEPGTWRRLWVAFALIVVLALAFYYLLPKLHVDIPWFVPVLAFAVIFVSTLLRVLAGARQMPEDAPPETPGEHPLRSDLERFG